MLTQTEVRPAAADVFGNWQTAASVQEPSPRVTAEEFREALSRVASSVSDRLDRRRARHCRIHLLGRVLGDRRAADHHGLRQPQERRQRHHQGQRRALRQQPRRRTDRAVADVRRRRPGADERAVCRPTLERARHRIALLHAITRRARLPGRRHPGSRHPQRDLSPKCCRPSMRQTASP